MTEKELSSSSEGEGVGMSRILYSWGYKISLKMTDEFGRKSIISFTYSMIIS